MTNTLLLLLLLLHYFSNRSRSNSKQQQQQPQTQEALLPYKSQKKKAVQSKVKKKWKRKQSNLLSNPLGSNWLVKVCLEPCSAGSCRLHSDDTIHLFLPSRRRFRTAFASLQLENYLTVLLQFRPSFPASRRKWQPRRCFPTDSPLRKLGRRSSSSCYGLTN